MISKHLNKIKKCISFALPNRKAAFYAAFDFKLFTKFASSENKEVKTV